MPINTIRDPFCGFLASALPGLFLRCGLRASRVCCDDPSRREPSFAERKPLNELDVVGHLRVPNHATFAAEEDDRIALRENVSNLRALIV